MAKSNLFRTALLTAAIAIIAVGGSGAVRAADPRAPETRISATDAGARFVPLGIGKSVVVDLPSDVKDVLVSDPKIVNAVVRSVRRAYLIGIAAGQANVFFFDANGRQIAGFDIAVTRNLNGVHALLKQRFPDAGMRIEGVGDGVMLSGAVNSPVDAQQAYDLAVRLVGDGAKVINGIVVKGRDQVMLKVTVAEVQRDVVKQLGIDLTTVPGGFKIGSAVIDFASATSPLTSNFLKTTTKSMDATLRALESAGVIRTLAEPNLTAISGETATFLAGGEFPIPGGLACDSNGRNCQVSVQFKKFGVGLNFTPVVLSEGRISLKVMTEVSDLSNENAISIKPSADSPAITIPSVLTRRTETTVEIPSGGALALAGMIQEGTKQKISGTPGLMQLPVLGPLFRSRDYVNRQTELVVLVTPYIVRAVAQKDLSRPDDGFADASDPASVLMGRLNRIYGVNNRAAPNRMYQGQYGFILD